MDGPDTACREGEDFLHGETITQPVKEEKDVAESKGRNQGKAQ